MININHALTVFTIPLFILTWYCSYLIDQNQLQYIELQEKLWECQDINSEDGIFKTNVTVTMYHPIKGQTDSTPDITADGTKINIWKASSYRYIAVSRDLLSRWGGPLNYGDWIVIEGAGTDSGVYQIRDTMNPKWTKRVDILKTPGSKPFKYTNITLTKYGTESQANLALID